MVPDAGMTGLSPEARGFRDGITIIYKVLSQVDSVRLTVRLLRSLQSFWRGKAFIFCRQLTVVGNFSIDIHSFNKYLLKTYYMPGTMPDIKDKKMTKDMVPEERQTGFSIELVCCGDIRTPLDGKNSTFPLSRKTP